METNFTVPVLETTVVEQSSPMVETTVVEQSSPMETTVDVAETNGKRGRAPSEQTVAIRNMLDADENLTFKKAEPILKELGFNVTQTQFNGIKQQWKDHKKPVNINFQPSGNVTMDEALQFVSEAGGLQTAEKMVNHHLALLNKFKAYHEQMKLLVA